MDESKLISAEEFFQVLDSTRPWLPKRREIAYGLMVKGVRPADMAKRFGVTNQYVYQVKDTFLKVRERKLLREYMKKNPPVNSAGVLKPLAQSINHLHATGYSLLQIATYLQQEKGVSVGTDDVEEFLKDKTKW